jgi:hypothetical protein
LSALRYTIWHYCFWLIYTLRNLYCNLLINIGNLSLRSNFTKTLSLISHRSIVITLRLGSCDNHWFFVPFPVVVVILLIHFIWRWTNTVLEFVVTSKTSYWTCVSFVISGNLLFILVSEIVLVPSWIKLANLCERR